jgi:hypothetical protein
VCRACRHLFQIVGELKMKKDIDLFIKEDHEGHLARSLDAILQHADYENELTMQERKEYFHGLMGAFPMMLMGHYYGWLIDEEPKEYFEKFIPEKQGVFESYVNTLTDQIFTENVTLSGQAARLAVYLQTYPFDLLRAFTVWAAPDAVSKADLFVEKERSDHTEKLTAFVIRSVENGDYVSAASYLAGDYPFELLCRYHKAVME